MAETYNEAVEKLRKIVADIENGDLDVDIPVSYTHLTLPTIA